VWRRASVICSIQVRSYSLFALCLCSSCHISGVDGRVCAAPATNTSAALTSEHGQRLLHHPVGHSISICCSPRDRKLISTLKHVNQRCVKGIQRRTKAANISRIRRSKSSSPTTEFYRHDIFTSSHPVSYLEDPSEAQHGSSQRNCERRRPASEASSKEGTHCHSTSCQSDSSHPNSRITVRDHGRTNCQPRS